MKLGAIVKLQQPGIYKQLNNSNSKKERKSKKDHLSFDFYKRIMESNKGVDERKCRGR